MQLKDSKLKQYSLIYLINDLIFHTYNRYGVKLLLLIILMFTIAITEGLSMALLLPLLNILGVPSPDKSIIMDIFNSILVFFPLNNDLINISLLLLSVLTFQIIFMIIQIWYLSWIQRDYGAHWQKNLAKAFVFSNINFMNRQKIGDLTNLCINETTRVSGSFMLLLQILTMTLTILMYIIIACVISLKITSSIIIITILLVFFLKGIGKKIFILGIEIGPLTSSLNVSLTEYLSSLKIIKSTVTENKILNQILIQIDELRLKHTFATFFPSLIKTFLEYGSFLILSGLIILGYKFLDFSTGNILVIVAIFIRLLPKFNSLQQNVQVLSSYIPAFKNISNKLEEANQNSEFKNFDFDKSKNKSKFSGDLLISLKKASYGKVKVLEDIEIKFPSTGTTAIIGDSGSGKTSLINCILGFINNYEGNILMSGKNLKTTPINFWRKNIGYVPQENILLNRTIKENISWGKINATDNEVIEASKLANSHNFIIKQKNGYNTIIGEKGNFLSGGQKQRISVARALILKPKVLIFDEASSSLDANSEDNLFKTINQLKKKLSIIFVTHKLNKLKYFDKIIYMEKGKVINQGDLKSLLRNKKFKQLLDRS